MSKLPFSLIATVRPLARDPTAVSDPYKELKELLLQSYGLSDEQMTNKWLDCPMCGDTRPSVLWDNLTALQPAMMKDVQTALFLRKLPRHISNLINTRAFNTTEEMIQRCNALWMSQTPEEAASAAAAAAAAPAVPSQQSPFRNSRRSPSPYRRKRPSSDKTGRRRSPTPGAAKGGRNDGLCFYHSTRQQGPQVQEGLLLPGKLIGLRPAHTSPPPPVLSQPAAPPLLFSTGISHSNVYFSNKKPNFPS
jgi:hypothetical protein